MIAPSPFRVASSQIALFIVSMLLAASPLLAGDPKSPAWTAKDSAEAVRFVDDMIHHPTALDSQTAAGLFRDHDLSFGYKLREAWVNPAGRLGFSLKLVYQGKKMIGFEARPVLNYAGLRAHYLNALRGVFKTDPKFSGNPNEAPLLPYYWNLDALAEPLPLDSLAAKDTLPLPSPSIREALSFYMTPFSGTLYGLRGGQAGQILENRDGFIGLMDILMADKKLARYLLRSINPASRLTAAEFIIRNRENFPDYDELMKNELRIVFTHPSKAATLHGGTETFENARKLANDCAAQSIQRDGRGVLRMY